MTRRQYPDGRLLTAQGEIRLVREEDLQKGVRQGQLFYVYDVEEMLEDHLLNFLAHARRQEGLPEPDRQALYAPTLEDCELLAGKGGAFLPRQFPHLHRYTPR